MLYMVVLTFEPAVLLSVAIQMKAIEQCSLLVLFVMVFKEVQAFKVVHHPNMLLLVVKVFNAQLVTTFFNTLSSLQIS